MLKWLATLVLALLLMGLFTPWLQRLGWGRLPGDLNIKLGSREKRRLFYFPLTSVVLGSLLLSLIVWLLGR